MPFFNLRYLMDLDGSCSIIINLCILSPCCFLFLAWILLSVWNETDWIDRDQKEWSSQILNIFISLDFPQWGTWKYLEVESSKDLGPGIATSIELLQPRALGQWNGWRPIARERHCASPHPFIKWIQLIFSKQHSQKQKNNSINPCQFFHHP